MKKANALTLTLMAAAMMSVAAQAGDTYIPSREQAAVAKQMVNTSAAPAVGTYPDFTEAAENTINSVVSIKNYQTPRQQQYQGNDFGFFDPFDFFFGDGQSQQRRRQQQQQQQQKQSDAKPQLRGSGSGVIISEDGYIVTNNHVVDGADKLTVTLNNNDEYTARVIGTDAKTDLALIKIAAKGLHPIVMGNSDNLKVGQWVVAVGNPFGLNSTVTAGIVSAKARGVSESNSIKSFIQHDAAVNPGNSGGALVTTDGKLVGINTMIYSQTGNYSGCSFAIPSNTVSKIVTDIRKYGNVQRAVLGISYRELDADLAKEKKVTATHEGIYVNSVTEDGAAKEAGLQEGDVIVKLNGSDVKNSGEMQEVMNSLRPGDKASVDYYRAGKLRHTTVTLKNDAGTTKITKQSDFNSLGCAFKKLNESEKDDLGVKNGVKVVGLRAGKFKTAGVPDGFVITEINGDKVDSQDDVEGIYDQVMRSKDSDKVLLLTGVTSTGKKKYIAVDISDEEPSK